MERICRWMPTNCLHVLRIAPDIAKCIGPSSTATYTAHCRLAVLLPHATPAER